MIDIQYGIWVFIRPITKQVAIRVRWNKKKSTVTFVTNMHADPNKWDKDGQKPLKSTTHCYKDMKYTAAEINECISDFKQEIALVFESFEKNNSVPTATELKDLVNSGLGRKEEVFLKQKLSTQEVLPLRQLFALFIKEGQRYKGWDKTVENKYKQALDHLQKAVPRASADNITIDTMYDLKDWYAKEKYKNRTAKKQFNMLKAFLKWINKQPGYTIPDDVLTFSPNLTVIRRTVTFLHYDELQKFTDFPLSSERLRQARDQWCFMAYTSLRYSDLANLKTGHINNGRIEMVTQKTNDRIHIPIIDAAQKIIDKYTPTEDGHVFDVISNQKLNDYIKEAAKEAGLDRPIIETYYVGNERKERQYKFYEIISCHDARRTFVSCSLAMDIPPQVVMKATGHKAYKTMQIYLDTATETQAIEMEKWNRNQYRAQIISSMENLSEDQLKAVLSNIHTMLAK